MDAVLALTQLALSAAVAAGQALAHPRVTWTVWREAPGMLRSLDAWRRTLPRS